MQERGGTLQLEDPSLSFFPGNTLQAGKMGDREDVGWGHASFPLRINFNLVLPPPARNRKRLAKSLRPTALELPPAEPSTVDPPCRDHCSVQVACHP